MTNDDQQLVESEPSDIGNILLIIGAGLESFGGRQGGGLSGALIQDLARRRRNEAAQKKQLRRIASAMRDPAFREALPGGLRDLDPEKMAELHSIGALGLAIENVRLVEDEDERAEQARLAAAALKRETGVEFSPNEFRALVETNSLSTVLQETRGDKEERRVRAAQEGYKAGLRGSPNLQTENPFYTEGYQKGLEQLQQTRVGLTEATSEAAGKVSDAILQGLPPAHIQTIIDGYSQVFASKATAASRIGVAPGMVETAKAQYDSRVAGLADIAIRQDLETQAIQAYDRSEFAPITQPKDKDGQNNPILQRPKVTAARSDWIRRRDAAFQHLKSIDPQNAPETLSDFVTMAQTADTASALSVQNQFALTKAYQDAGGRRQIEPEVRRIEQRRLGLIAAQRQSEDTRQIISRGPLQNIVSAETVTAYNTAASEEDIVLADAQLERDLFRSLDSMSEAELIDAARIFPENTTIKRGALGRVLQNYPTAFQPEKIATFVLGAQTVERAQRNLIERYFNEEWVKANQPSADQLVDQMRVPIRALPAIHDEYRNAMLDEIDRRLGAVKGVLEILDPSDDAAQYTRYLSEQEGLLQDREHIQDMRSDFGPKSVLLMSAALRLSLTTNPKSWQDIWDSDIASRGLTQTFGTPTEDELKALSPLGRLRAIADLIETNAENVTATQNVSAQEQRIRGAVAKTQIESLASLLHRQAQNMDQEGALRALARYLTGRGMLGLGRRGRLAEDIGVADVQFREPAVFSSRFEEKDRPFTVDPIGDAPLETALIQLASRALTGFEFDQ